MFMQNQSCKIVKENVCGRLFHISLEPSRSLFLIFCIANFISVHYMSILDCYSSNINQPTTSPSPNHGHNRRILLMTDGDGEGKE